MLRKYFIRRLRLHFVSMLIPTLIIFLVIGAIMINLEQRSLRDESRSCLAVIDESLDASLYNMGYQIDSLMTNASFSLSLKKILRGTQLRQGESSVFSMIKNFFRSYEISYSYINSIYLYLDGEERFLSTAAGYVVNTEGYFDREWLAEYRRMKPEEKIYTSRREIVRSTYEEPVEVLSLYYRLSYLDGVIVINTDRSEYGDFLRNMILGEGQQILLYNSAGQSLGSGTGTYAGDRGAALETALTGQITKESMSAYTDVWKHIGGDSYYLYTRYSPYMNMFLVSACPVGMVARRMAIFLWIALAVLAVQAIVMLILAYRYTRQSFAFIEQYIDIFSAAERGEYVEKPAIAESDEYGMILNNIIYMYLQHSRMELELQEKEYAKTLAEMASLQMQINPHFIFNTLQIMDFDVIRQMGRQSQIHRMLQRLSEVVKYALSDPMEEVTIRTEIDYLKAYLDIQNVRFDNNGITYFEVDESVWEMHVFRLLLQPILENCFEHGMHTDGSRIVIKVKIFNRGDHLAFSVTDNGQGMTKEEREQLMERIRSADAKSIGLVNLNRRLILHYGEESALHILSRKNAGTVISFRIPITAMTAPMTEKEENKLE